MAEPIFTMTPARIGDMRRALLRLARPDVRVTSLAFLAGDELAALREEAARQTYRMATPVIEHRGNRVRQDFEVCFPAPRTGAFAELATLLEDSIMAAAATPQPLLPDATIDLADFAIQRYPAGSDGIGIPATAALSRHWGLSRLMAPRVCSPAMTVTGTTSAASTTGRGGLFCCRQKGLLAAMVKAPSASRCGQGFRWAIVLGFRCAPASA